MNAIESRSGSQSGVDDRDAPTPETKGRDAPCDPDWLDRYLFDREWRREQEEADGD